MKLGLNVSSTGSKQLAISSAIRRKNVNLCLNTKIYAE